MNKSDNSEATLNIGQEHIVPLAPVRTTKNRPEPCPKAHVAKKKPLLSAYHNIVFTIFDTGKWFQLCQLSFIVFCLLIGINNLPNDKFIRIAETLSPRQSQFIYITSSIFCVFYILQIVYVCIYKLIAGKKLAYITQLSDADTTPEQLSNQQYHLNSQSKQANKYIISSIFGIFLFIAFITSSLLFEYAENAADAKIAFYITSWAFIIPSLMAWAIIHYKRVGFNIIFALYLACCLEAVFSIPFVVLGILLCSIVMVLILKYNLVLRFFSILGTIAGILILLMYGLFSAIKINSTACSIVFLMCFIPAIVSIVLQFCARECKVNTADSSDSLIATAPKTSSLYQQIFNIFYSYVWGSICALIFIIISIIYIVDNCRREEKSNFFNNIAEKITIKAVQDKTNSNGQKTATQNAKYNSSRTTSQSYN